MSTKENQKIKVFLIHGFEGSPNGGWRPYVMSELQKQDIYTCALPMPNPEAPELDAWLTEIDRVVKRCPDDDVYLIGHSLGGTAILRYLEAKERENIRGIILVSTPCSPTANKTIDGFLSRPFDWAHLQALAIPCVVIHGDNDPLVPLADARHITDKLNAELHIIPDGKHLNGSAGFTALPVVAAALLRLALLKSQLP